MAPWNAAQLVTGLQFVRAICAAVFSCVMTLTVSGNSVVLPVWSKCVWVWRIVVTGRSVTPRTYSRMSAP